MIQRSIFSSKSSFEHIECSPDSPNERKIFRQKSWSHSLNVRKRWRSFFHRYDHHQIFLLELGNAVLTILRKKFLLKSKRFHSMWKSVIKNFFKTTPPKRSFGHTQCLFDKFFKRFPSFPSVDWSLFGQPPKKILWTFSSPKSSFGHTKWSSYNLV